MPSATIEKIHKVRVAPTTGSVMAMDGQEDAKIVVDLPNDIAQQLTRDLIAAGYGPTQRGGRA